jgi:hypothetical protein
MDGTIRMRTAAWFATAVVISVFATLLVMQEWRADAAPGDSDATWVAVEPCRLFDYRPGKEPSGGKKTPLAAGAQATQQVTGTVGNCKIPTTGVVAISMNVTIVSPTAQSNLRLYPADAAKEPVVSNLNWLAGDSAKANKVDVKLSAAGAVKVAVANGTVNVLGDIVGYYTDESLKELDTRVTSLEAKAGASAFAGGQSLVDLGADKVVKSVSLMPTADGQVIVNSSGFLQNLSATDVFAAACSITTGTTVDSSAQELSNVPAPRSSIFNRPGRHGDSMSHPTRSLRSTTPAHWMRERGQIGDAALTAIFVPT